MCTFVTRRAFVALLGTAVYSSLCSQSPRRRSSRCV